MAESKAYRANEIDATAMKAFAHPLRMAMYAYLTDHGAATATMLASHLGESTGQTSYHLRQLERHGFVAEDESRGTGRERWWRPVGYSMQGTALAQDAGNRGAVELMLQTQLQQRVAAMSDWYRRSEQEPAEWVEGSVDSSMTTWMTAAEMLALTDGLMGLIHDHAERAKARHERGDTAGERRVRTYLDVFPLSTG